MNTNHKKRRSRTAVAPDHRGKLVVFSMACALLLAVGATAMDAEQGLLDCRQIEDRGQRIACLEDLLDTVEESSSPAADSSAAPPTAPVPDQPTRQLAEDEAQGSRAARFGLGGSPRVTQDSEGRDVLHDTVAAVEESRPDFLLITLEGGQVWQQVHPRRYNLRKGDSVRIHNTSWGKNYRLDSPALSGFIQVLRVE